MSENNRVNEMIEAEAQSEALRFIEGFGPIKERCESPIEELLMAALYVSKVTSEINLEFMPSTYGIRENPYCDQAVFIYQQAPVGPYRVDILIQDVSMPLELASPRFMVVECDGHDFHEKTKEQARRDKQRDRFLQSKGFKVLRFTGSEIWADPEKCADEIIDEFASNDTWRNRKK